MIEKEAWKKCELEPLNFSQTSSIKTLKVHLKKTALKVILLPPNVEKTKHKEKRKCTYHHRYYHCHPWNR